MSNLFNPTAVLLALPGPEQSLPGALEPGRGIRQSGFRLQAFRISPVPQCIDAGFVVFAQVEKLGIFGREDLWHVFYPEIVLEYDVSCHPHLILPIGVLGSIFAVDLLTSYW